MIINKYHLAIHSFIVLLSLSGCSNTTSENNTNSAQTTHSNTSKVKNKPQLSKEDASLLLLHNEYQKWENTPFRLGGTGKSGIDCSALVQNIYQDSFNIQLPRTTSTQVLKGTQIHKNKLQIADLVFFKTGVSTRHVGIYIGDNQFLHASTSKGVIVSSLDNVYWRSKYWQSRRISQN